MKREIISGGDLSFTVDGVIMDIPGEPITPFPPVRNNIVELELERFNAASISVVKVNGIEFFPN